jgi:CubicO group peptidase (beta-lactamase class C family)
VVAAGALRANGAWTAIVIDLAISTGEKRDAALNVLLGHILPKGGGRESFVGRAAHPLDAEHVKILTDFVDKARQDLQIPGVAVAIVDHDKVVFEGGFGVRELGKKPPVDKDTRFMIASNTKALTTLMLAKLVDEKKVTWDAPVAQLFPGFALGDADTTKQVQLRHLVCACTGLPRQDLEWIFEFKQLTPAGVVALLAKMQPTSKFGEMFQYSNALAAVGGYVGAHILYPKKELGAAYDEAMRTQVFVPLGMKDVTFDFKKALAGNHAGTYGIDLDGNTAPDVFEINYASVPFRPAGGLWASVHDMIRYVRMELGNGMLDGKRVIGEDALLERRKANVPISQDATYGMGLMVDTTYGVTVVHHGGDLIGHHSDMMWLPDQQIGAVILTNGDNGPILRAAFLRRMLEVVFDGKPEAEENVATAVRDQKAGLAAERPHLTIPPDPTEVGKLAAHYQNDALGALDVKRDGKALVFDFGEWKSEAVSRKNDDGTVSFVLSTPGLGGEAFVVGDKDGKRTLTIRDAQHEYVFTEK